MNQIEFSKRVFIGAAITMGVLLAGLFIWFALRMFMVLFAGCLLSVFLYGTSKWIARRILIPQKLVLVLIVIITIVASVLGTWFYGNMFYFHANQFITNLTSAVNQLTAENDLAMRIYSEITKRLQEISSVDVLTNLRAFFTSTLGYLFDLFVIFFVGIYVAFKPQIYINGLLALFSGNYQPRIREAVINVYKMLKWWLLGRLASMLLIGAFTVFGLWMLDVPMAITLGILAALFEFIPYLGPILASIPAIIIAFTISPITSLYVLILYVIIQQIEGYLVTPLIQEGSISMPPALTLAVQIFFGITTGGIGLLMATPLTAVGIVLIQMLYIEDVLHNDVKVLGEH